MYEDMTFEKIMERCLSRVSDSIDKREGSLIYDAIAPAAAELAIMYIELSYLKDCAYPDTASGSDLAMLTKQRGIIRSSATYAIRKGMFAGSTGPMDVPIGSRYSGGDLNFVVTEKAIDGDGVFLLRCEAPGVQGNQYFGNLLPIDFIDGLVTASLGDVIIPGEDEEDDENLRKRYFDSLSSQAFGGNVTDYKEKVNAIPGVGSCKVYPTWNGGGTVKIVFDDSESNVPSAELVNTVQEQLDPTINHGKGYGIAPIGHTVTVEGVIASSVDISMNVTYKEDWDFEATKPYMEKALDAYFKELASNWANDEFITVRISQIESRMIEIDSIVDISGTKINGEEQNLALAANAIPVRGQLNG